MYYFGNNTLPKYKLTYQNVFFFSQNCLSVQDKVSQREYLLSHCMYIQFSKHIMLLELAKSVIQGQIFLLFLSLFFVITILAVFSFTPKLSVRATCHLPT
jgi:hypothetical protein